MTPHEITLAAESLPDPLKPVREMCESIAQDPMGLRAEENFREACS